MSICMKIVGWACFHCIIFSIFLSVEVFYMVTTCFTTSLDNCFPIKQKHFYIPAHKIPNSAYCNWQPLLRGEVISLWLVPCCCYNSMQIYGKLYLFCPYYLHSFKKNIILISSLRILHRYTIYLGCTLPQISSSNSSPIHNPSLLFPSISMYSFL